MKSVLSEKFVRKSIILWLRRKGWGRNLEERPEGEHGPDIRVRHNRYARYYFVETKGDPDPKRVKFPSSRREVSFMYAIGQIITRMKPKAFYKYALGFPESYRDLVLRRIPWGLCQKLHLSVLLVNKEGKVEEITWKKLKSCQK